MKIILYGPPRTKKNSQQIVDTKSGKKMLIQGKTYRLYEQACIEQLRYQRPANPEEKPFNVKCVYYMPNDMIVDLVNLLEATDDILVNGGILEDDNKKVIGAHDGCRVLVDKAMPRVEITITRLKD